ncbi:MAG: carbohydrate-binding domain-containing protein, partial [Dorea sp.]|nr:carbohydrate-binding domain-containing protein [Dorea sp.]
MTKINKVAWLFLLALGLSLQGCSNQNSDNPAEKNNDKQVEAESETFDKTEASEVKEDMLDDEESSVVTIQLKGDTAWIDGVDVESFDYTWHTDPSHEEEWYEGTEPQTEAAAYIAHDIWYYPTLDTDGFTLENYDGENEWVYHYTADGLTDYIYSTLPYQGEEVPVEMMHTEEEAYACPVLHITKPGTYSLQGTWKGQIFVDLGDKDDTFTDEKAKVTIVLNGVDVECTCAPAFIAY